MGSRCVRVVEKPSISKLDRPKNQGDVACMPIRRSDTKLLFMEALSFPCSLRLATLAPGLASGQYQVGKANRLLVAKAIWTFSDKGVCTGVAET